MTKPRPDIKSVADQIEDINEIISDLESRINRYFNRVHIKGAPTGGFDVGLMKNAHSIRQNILSDYEEWCHSVRPIIKAYHINSIEEFDQMRSLFRSTIKLEKGLAKGTNSLKRTAVDALVTQRSLLTSTPKKLKSEELVSPRRISSDLTTDEIEKAQSYLKTGIPEPQAYLPGSL